MSLHLLRRTLSAVLLVGTVAGLPRLRAQVADAVVNGGFEDGLKNWWGPGLDSKTATVVRDGAASDDACLRLAADWICQDKRPVVGGSNYRVSMQIRCDGAADDSAYVQLSFRGGGLGPAWHGPVSLHVGDHSEAVLYATGGTHAWRELSAVITVPAVANEVLVYLRRQGNVGTAFFDEVAITPTDEPPAQRPLPKEIVHNGGFEEGLAGWWGPGAKDAIVRDGATEGKAALRLSGGWVCQDKRPIQGGRNYRVSMRIKTEGSPKDAAYAQLSFRGIGVDGGWRGPQRIQLGGRSEPALFTTGGTADWQEFSAVVAAPRGADQVLLYLRKRDQTEGTVMYDAVKIDPTDEQPVTAATRRRDELAAEWLAPSGTPYAAKPRDLAPPRSLSLAEGGKALYRIHVADPHDVVVLHAAIELARYLEQMTGASFAPLAHDQACADGPLIVVGRGSALVDELCPGIKYDTLGKDGFVLRTAGPHVVIAGATPRGTMYGVYWWLDRHLGVKWLSPSYTHVPRRPTLALAPLATVQKPRFSYREILSTEGQDKSYRARNLLNGESHGPSFLATPPEIDSWEHDWMAKDGTANFFQLLPQTTYAKDHPGWYAGGQLAMMDLAMRQEMANVIARRLTAHPDYRSIWFNVHDMDWGWDMDPASTAFAAKHGGRPSAPRLDMVVDVADRVRKVLPGARLAFNAYHWSFTPPEGMTVPDYVLVFPMTIHVDYDSALNKGRNERLGRDIARWSEIATNVQVWDHIANWSGFLQPTPNLYPIGESIQWLATLPNVRGYFAEGSWDTPAAEFASLRVWVMARLLWDSSLDPRALVAEFCELYYGKAGASIKAYIDAVHEAAGRSGDVISEKFQVDLAMYDLDFVLTAERLFDEAERLVAGDAQRLPHVREARMPVDYVVLVRRAEYAAEAERRGIAWRPGADVRLERFNRALTAGKVRQYRQGGNLGELTELLAVERHAAQPHERVRNLPRADWHEVQDLGVNRYHTARIVADPLASDGAAVRMEGKHSTWAMQLKMEKLPQEGSWDVHADLRVEAEPGNDSELAVRVGSAPPMNRFTPVTVGQAPATAYQLVKVPGGPFRFEVNHEKSIYLQAAAKDAIRHVYLDRFVMVRVPGE